MLLTSPKSDNENCVNDIRISKERKKAVCTGTENSEHFFWEKKGRGFSSLSERARKRRGWCGLWVNSLQEGRELGYGEEHSCVGFASCWPPPRSPTLPSTISLLTCATFSVTKLPPGLYMYLCMCYMHIARVLANWYYSFIWVFDRSA